MTLDEFEIEQDYLEHYGIKGMKWGVRRTPEELGHYINKQKTKLEKTVAAARKAKASGNMKRLNKYNEQSKKIAADIRKAQAEKREAEKTEATEKEAERQKLLKTGSAEDILKRKEDFTQDEINQAIKRINTEISLSSLKDADKIAKAQRANQMINTMTNLGQTSLKAVQTYDDVAMMVNKAFGRNTMWSPTQQAKKREYEWQLKINEIVNSGSYEQINNNRSILSPTEFQSAMRNMNLERTNARSVLNSETGVLTSLNGQRGTVNQRITDLTNQQTQINNTLPQVRQARSDVQNQINQNQRALRTATRNGDHNEAVRLTNENNRLQTIVDNYNTQENTLNTRNESVTRSLETANSSLQRLDSQINDTRQRMEDAQGTLTRR